uniref:Cellulase n=1 Tax=Acrobeloides nanus TaxID=290746 RepID=A0A914CP22_9BILA
MFGQKVASAIEAAVETGIYVIVDWHDFDWHLEQAIPFFANISQLYGKYPHVLYETYNEPSWADSWANLTVYHTAIIKAIRANDPENVIIVGTPRASIDVDIAAAAPLNFSNIAYTLHFYTNIPNTTWGGNIMEKAQKAIDMNLPIFVTEYGVCSANGQGLVDYNVSQMFWDFLDTNKISYLAWTISDDKGCYYTLKYPTNASQVGDKDYWTESGAYINKKLWSTDQGVTCPSTCSCPSDNWYQSTVNPCNCYAFIQTPLNWNSANNACRQQNPKATLISIDSAFENNEILASGKNQTTCTQFFIGLERDMSNTWYWSNNDTSKYFNWRASYPNSNSNDKCSQLNTNDGTWTNIDCATTGCYICEIKNA